MTSFDIAHTKKNLQFFLKKVILSIESEKKFMQLDKGRDRDLYICTIFGQQNVSVIELLQITTM